MSLTAPTGRSVTFRLVKNISRVSKKLHALDKFLTKTLIFLHTFCIQNIRVQVVSCTVGPYKRFFFCVSFNCTVTVIDVQC